MSKLQKGQCVSTSEGIMCLLNFNLLRSSYLFTVHQTLLNVNNKSKATIAKLCTVSYYIPTKHKTAVQVFTVLLLFINTSLYI